MDFDLAAMTRRATATRRKVIVLPAITPTKALAADLAAIYLQVVKEWQRQATEVIVPAYAAAVAELNAGFADAAKMSDDLSNLRNAAEGSGSALERMLAGLAATLRIWTLRGEGWHRSRWIRNVASATGVDLSTMLGPADVRETLETVLLRNVALVKSVSDQTRARIADIIYRGFQSRAQARDIAREISEATGMARRRALGIASDQTVKLSAELDTERFRQAGITDWRWVHSGKKHFRPTHRARNGRVYSLNNPPAEMPGVLPYCGCKKQAVIRLASGRFS